MPLRISALFLAVLLCGCSGSNPDPTPSAEPAPAPAKPAPAPAAVVTKPTPAVEPAAPPPATIPRGSDPFAGAAPVFSAWTGLGDARTVAITGRTFAEAFEVRTTRRPTAVHGVKHTWVSTAAVAAGQPLLLDVSLRGVELQSAAYVVQAYVLISGNGEQVLKTTLNADATWKRFRVAAVATRAHAAGALKLEIQYGVDAQVLQVGGVSVTAYPASVRVADLPSEGFDYAGRAPDAPWRIEAAQRIERLRTQQLTLRGTPGSTVRVQQLRHAFPIGTALSSNAFGNIGGPDQQRYRTEIERLFTQVTFEGEHKWPAWEQPKRRAVAEEMAARCAERGIAVYGHTLVWGGWNFLPERLKALEGDPEKLRAEVRAHVSEQATTLRGRVVAWDVINEPYTQADLLRILGRTEAAEWFRLAATADPAARLVLNDYEILDSRAASPAHRDFLEALIRELQAAKAPLQGLGFQGHMYPGFTPPEQLWKILDRFAAFGLPIAITEHDINTGDEQLQADYARDFLLAVMAHPAVHGLTLWGFWDGSHWKGNALLFRKDWTLKPSGEAWLDLLRGQWWTDREVTLAADGSATLRVWKGNYRIAGRTVEIADTAMEISP